MRVKARQLPDVYVGIGSNIEPQVHLKLAVEQLRQHFGELRCSSVYRSPAHGFKGEDFLNMVVGFAAAGDADLVEQTLSSIEYSGGRARQAERYVSRTLDLDLLLYGACVDPRRRLPRDDVLRFPFVLGPLAELAPGLRHPLTGIELGEAWRAMQQRPIVLQCLGPLAELH
ncbi:MAG TPA: 2-amino-4-hydroxy-6-hydroxymethyldihydropteridine diphosphokinase [Gammaproteobacteria bacterium]|nr:2-amino-4-hydroxy-6-hydroxymethyldihydropteridine diphosphokinase [Gammaproteobacteria bacterium]